MELAVAAAAAQLSNPHAQHAFYASLTTRPRHDEQLASGAISRAAEDPSLNRYSDCFPSNSHLAPTARGEYLNASLVLLRRAAAAPGVVVAAGPMAPEWHGPDTRAAFWGAVWANRVSLIVALAPPAAGFQGCAAYAVDGEFGDVSVELVEDVASVAAGLGGSAVERRLRLRKRGEREPRAVTQLEFRTWPNYGVDARGPASVAALASRVGELLPANGSGLLVHCAGGVGRSGAFATLASLWLDQAVLRGDSVFSGGAEGVLLEVRQRIELFREQRHPYGVESAVHTDPCCSFPKQSLLLILQQTAMQEQAAIIVGALHLLLSPAPAGEAAALLERIGQAAESSMYRGPHRGGL